MTGNVKTRKVIRLTLTYIVLCAVAVFCFYPALWVVLASFRPGTSLFSETLFPKSFTIVHYIELFEKYPFKEWYMNTLKIALSSMFIGTILVMLTGYVFSKFRFGGRKNLMSSLLVLSLFPGFMSLIALYILLNQMNLMNTHAAIILVSAAGAPLGFLYVKSYMDTIPTSLIEASRIDGASHYGIFFRIILPLSTPLIVFTSLTLFTGVFTDFIFAKLVLKTPEKLTLAVGLYNMIANNFGKPEFTMFAAGCVLVAVPITILFMILQRYLVEGLTAGADKG